LANYNNIVLLPHYNHISVLSIHLLLAIVVVLLYY
jgi:hypothetical protein